MSYTGPERRKYPRATSRFVVSYRIYENMDAIDISQTKNVSLGGMLLTTNRQFEKGVVLAIQIRLPFVFEPINMLGKVIESKEVVKDLIYDTRLTFLELDERVKKNLGTAVDFYLKKLK